MDREVKEFIVLPKRWIVEGTFGWVNLHYWRFAVFILSVNAACASASLPSALSIRSTRLVGCIGGSGAVGATGFDLAISR